MIHPTALTAWALAVVLAARTCAPWYWRNCFDSRAGVVGCCDGNCGSQRGVESLSGGFNSCSLAGRSSRLRLGCLLGHPEAEGSRASRPLARTWSCGKPAGPAWAAQRRPGAEHQRDSGPRPDRISVAGRQGGGKRKRAAVHGETAGAGQASA
jgi:hypothetical protein